MLGQLGGYKPRVVPSTSVPLTYKAGKCVEKVTPTGSKQIAPDRRKGTLSVTHHSRGGVVHAKIEWSPRDETGIVMDPEDTIVSTSGEVYLEKVPCQDGRVYVLRMPSSSSTPLPPPSPPPTSLNPPPPSTSLNPLPPSISSGPSRAPWFFWMQEPDEEQDEEFIKSFNAITCRKRGASSRQARALTPAPKAKPNDLKKMIEQVSVMRSAEDFYPAQTTEHIGLRDILTYEVLSKLIDEPEALAKLKDVMPPDYKTCNHVRAAMRSAQLRASADTLSSAIYSDQFRLLMGCLELGPPSLSQYSFKENQMAQFIKAYIRIYGEKPSEASEVGVNVQVSEVSEVEVSNPSDVNGHTEAPGATPSEVSEVRGETRKIADRENNQTSEVSEPPCKISRTDNKDKEDKDKSGSE